MRTTKYNYAKVIQFGYFGQWSDESEYATNSQGQFASKADRDLFKSDLKEYRLAHAGHGQTRVVFRRSPVKQ